MPARVVLGVGAGIAAYKACELLRLLTEAGHHVRVVPTPDALRFVGEATWAALSGEPASSGVWDDVHNVPHVRLGQTAELVFVAPATGDLLARAARSCSPPPCTPRCGSTRPRRRTLPRCGNGARSCSIRQPGG